MDIPSRLIDTTTVVKNHTLWTHLGCVFLRIALGLYIIFKDINKNYITLLSLITVLFFGQKVLNNNHTWKVYLRTTLTYILVIKLIHYNRKDFAGLLIIVDALMAVQSRHTATLLNN